MTARIHLIRHGKASPDGVDYDVLAPMGIEQTRMLGAHLGAIGQRYDAVYCGPLRRHRESLLHMREAAGEHSLQWPAERLVEGLREAPVLELIRDVLPQRMQTDSALVALVGALQSVEGFVEKQLAIKNLVNHLVAVWQRGELERDDVESHRQFQARTSSAWQQICEATRPGEVVAVMTSMGVISALVRQLRGDAADAPLLLEVDLANSSVTEVHVTGQRAVVHSLNAVAHLSRPELITYV